MAISLKPWSGAHPLALGLLRGLVLLAALLLLFWPRPAWAEAEAADLGRGAQLFANHCAGCHVNGGNIIRRGKTLQLKALERQGLASQEAIAAIAASGRGQMGAYGSVLGDDGVRDVAAWVWQQALADWPKS
jgi:cytochrome c6